MFPIVNHRVEDVLRGGLVTSTLFTLLVLPTFYLQVHRWVERRSMGPNRA